MEHSPENVSQGVSIADAVATRDDLQQRDGRDIALADDETSLDSNFVEDGSPSEGYAFLGAVHNLVTSKVSATKPDLILAAVSQSLRESDKTEDEILTVVNQIWPGARTDSESVSLALSLGKEIGLVTQQTGLGEVTLWSLTPRGVDDVDRQVAWVRDLRSRARNDLISRAHSGLEIEVTEETAELWLERLVNALIRGIQASQDAYFGRVDAVVGNRLIPRGIDQKSVFAAIEDDRVSEVTTDFLKAAAVSAFDPLDPFGNELISVITTGCVLHSYVAGRDAAAALDEIGSPVGQRALLDTPVLVDLVGPARVQSRVRFMLTAALKAGWEIVVCEHSLDELANLMEREIPKVKQSFTEAYEGGVKEEWYASLVTDQLPTYCVEVLRDGTYTTLDDMIGASKSLASELRSLGVQVRPHGNEHDSNAVERCRVALETDIANTGGGRSPAAIERDANSMAVVWRRRRRQKGTEWPGGWIITSDRHMAPAYKVVAPRDPIPLTLSMARWSTLLSATVAPAEVVELAAAAATQLVEEAMWLLPSRFPSDVAMSLAKQLSPERGGSELDIRYAQITLDDSLDAGGEARSASSLAGDVLAARAKRTTAIQNQGIMEARAKQQEAERDAEEARGLAASKSAEANRARKQAAKAKEETAAVAGELQWANRRTRRIAISLILSFTAAVILSLAVLLRVATWGLIAAGVALALAIIGGIRWSTQEKTRLVTLLVGALFEAAGVVATVIELVSAVQH